jgi:alpha-D-ribose 1-methylphosphonate 5-phosphate C-P lyase
MQSNMNNNKQTSVDQLFDQLSSEGLLGLFTHDQMMRAMEILDEAKAMHKEEIEDAHLEGQCDETEGYPLEIAKKYYNQTYGGNK